MISVARGLWMSLESLIWTCNPIFIPQVFNLKLLSLFDISSAMLARHSRRAIPTITKWVRMNGGSNHKYASTARIRRFDTLTNA